MEMAIFFFLLIDVFLGYTEVEISFKPPSTHTGEPFVYIKKEVFLCFLLGTSPASKFHMPTFRNTLSVPSSWAGRYRMGRFEEIAQKKT